MNEEQSNNDIIVKCKVRLARQIFPKDKIISNGDFGIISVMVLEVLEGEPQVNKWGTITITGTRWCNELNDDEIYTVIGKEVTHEKFGLQYELIFMCTDIKLDNKEDQYKFLEKILPEKQCIDIFKKFENPIEVLENKDVPSLCTIKGIGVQTALKIIDKYENNKDNSEAYVKLDKYGLTKNMIDKLVDFFGSPNVVVAKIEENPYLLIDEMDGIGWSKADEMALNNGLGEYSTNRVRAYIKYYLYEEANEGNTWVDIDDLLDAIDGTIGCELPQDTLSEVLTEMNENKIIWTNEEKDTIALMKYYKLEENVSKELKRLNTSENNFHFDNWKEKIKELEIRQDWDFTEEQKDGIQAILENQIVLVGGLAGTGKSSTVAGVLEVFKDDYSFAQTALSGRASCNLSEITGVEGYTIHRLLGYNPECGFIYNKGNPLPTDIIILDELSMVGADIFYKLIQAIQSGSKLIMLGDIGQLKSIGIGRIMLDVIESGYIKYIELTKIHRQASMSAIITDSIKIRNEEQIINKDFIGKEIRGELQDLELDIYTDKNETSDKIIEHFKNLLPQIENIFDIQVVVPMKKRGKASAYYLNNLLQEIIINTSNVKGLIIGENSQYPFTIYKGDKILNTKNDYKTINENGDITPIFNGDLGIVKDIDIYKQTITVDFGNKGIIYLTKKSLSNISLGYAITCHKCQGMGIKYVICGIDYSQYKLLSKEMVYTMLTRAKKYCVLCAENKALRYATTHNDADTSQTFLKYLLKKED